VAAIAKEQQTAVGDNCPCYLQSVSRWSRSAL